MFSFLLSHDNTTDDGSILCITVQYNIVLYEERLGAVSIEYAGDELLLQL